MHKVSEVIVVEGRYDKNTLSQVVDADILETSGFGIFKDRQKQKLLRRIAEQRGLVILTDSDGAGFVIRSFIRSCVPAAYLKHAYIPDQFGKERRKSSPSREGKLGVEGMRPEVLLEALRRAGVRFCDEAGHAEPRDKITKADFYALGLSGRQDSRARRAALLQELDLPERLTADGLLDILNGLMSRDDFLRRFPADPQRRAEEGPPAAD
jgi:ribonuclease M5